MQAILSSTREPLEEDISSRDMQPPGNVKSLPRSRFLGILVHVVDNFACRAGCRRTCVGKPLASRRPKRESPVPGDAGLDRTGVASLVAAACGSPAERPEIGCGVQCLPCNRLNLLVSKLSVSSLDTAVSKFSLMPWVVSYLCLP
jgi:hypothetical protein